MNVLVLCHAFPYPPHDGHVGPIYHFLRHLAPHLRMTLLTLRPEDESECEAGKRRFEDWGLDVRALREPGRTKVERAALCLRHGKWWMNRFYEPVLARAAAQALEAGEYDLVLAWGIMSQQHLPKSCPAPIVLMARDCLSLQHWRRWEARHSLYELFQWWKIGAMERAHFRRAARVFAVSPVDAEAMRRLAPAASMEVLPTGVDTDAFQPDPAREEPDVVLFSGVMDYAPNEDAAVWLAREIWPLVIRERPTARLRLAGRNPTERVRALASDPTITVTGPVEHMNDEVARAAVVVSPLRVGSGIKNKVMEAAFMARAMVVTALSLEGLPLAQDREVLAADEPEAFARAIVRLLEDEPLRRRLGEAARSAIEDEFAAEKLALRLLEALREVANGHA